VNARERIAERLWWAVPSADDTQAKAVAEEMLDAHAAEVRAKALSDFLFLLRYSAGDAAADKFVEENPELAEDGLDGIANPERAATIYAERVCSCDETAHPTWCPASIPADQRIAEIRQGTGDPLSPRELIWLKGAAGRHELHVLGARIGEWRLTDDLSGALLLVSQYLAAATAVIERSGLVKDELSDAPADFFRPGHVYASGTLKFRCDIISAGPGTGERRALGWKFAPVYGVDGVHHWYAIALDPDDWQHGGWTETGDGS
jgi:hypothetical protein